MKTTLICDLDGTLALDDHRRPLIQSQGWKAYFDACVDDTLNEATATFVKLWAFHCLHIDNGKIVILTGRCESQRAVTEEWLQKHGIPHDHLLMRPQDSYDPLAVCEDTTDGKWTRDEDVKLAMIQELGLRPENVICCLDDRDRMVIFWREMGFDCWQVRPGAF